MCTGPYNISGLNQIGFKSLVGRFPAEFNPWSLGTFRIKAFCCNIVELEVKGPSGPRLLVGGPSGLLTSSFAPYGRSGRYVGPALGQARHF